MVTGRTSGKEGGMSMMDTTSRWWDACPSIHTVLGRLVMPTPGATGECFGGD